MTTSHFCAADKKEMWILTTAFYLSSDTALDHILRNLEHHHLCMQALCVKRVMKSIFLHLEQFTA